MIVDPDNPLILSLGAVREGYAAIEAFGDLLGSRRVGPRALTRAKVAAAEGCVALVGALAPFQRTLETALGKDCGAELIVQPLCDRLRSHVSAISTALLDWSSLNARHRLSLDILFRKYRADIKDCVALCDLAVAAATAVPVELDLVGVLERRQTDRVPETRAVNVGIDVEGVTVFRTDRHVLAGLIEQAVAFVCRDVPSPVVLAALARPDGAFVIRVRPAGSNWTPKRQITMVRRGELDLGLEVARMVARRSGVDMSFDYATNAASIVIT